MNKALYFCILVGLVILIGCGKKNSTASNSVPKKPKKEGSARANSTEKKADAVIKAAKSYTGTPYKYGGTSRAGIDCSGLTCASFKAIDIALPRTSNEQSTFGKSVGLSELQKGDLVFFTDKKGGKKITHVGIITEVNGTESAKFIHSSTKLGVVEVDLFSNYYKPLILKAIRVLD